MWSPCICIGALLNMRSPMKTRSLTRIGGGVTPPGVRSAGRLSANGSPNLRLELGHHLLADPVRTSEFASAHLAEQAPVADSVSPLQGSRPTEVASSWKAGRFTGRDFVFQPDGTLRCPAGQKLSAHERRREDDGSLRVVYLFSIT